MTNFPAIINYALGLTAAWRYPLVGLGTVLEGPFIMVASGFFLKLGFFSLWPIFFTLVIGDLVGDVIWYYIGYFFLLPTLERTGHFLSITPDFLARWQARFQRYHEGLLFVSKITLGFGLALGTLMVAGATRVPFSRFLLTNFFGELVLVGIMLAIGHSFGQFYLSIKGGLQIFFLIGIIPIILLAFYGLTTYLKQQFQS